MMAELYSGVAVNTDSPKIVTPPPPPPPPLQSLLAIKNWHPQRNIDSPKKCYKVMGSQYLRATKSSPETITVKFEHLQWQFKFELELHKTVSIRFHFIKSLSVQE